MSNGGGEPLECYMLGPGLLSILHRAKWTLSYIVKKLMCIYTYMYIYLYIYTHTHTYDKKLPIMISTYN